MKSSAGVTSTMMKVNLSLNHFLERAGTLFPSNEIVSRLPDKSLVKHTYGQFYCRTRSLAQSLKDLGLKKGDRVATLCWNHHAHLECYFGIPAAGGVMHTLNLRLSPDEIAWIANDPQDRFLNFQVTSMDWLALSKDGHRRARLTPYGVLNWLVL